MSDTQTKVIVRYRNQATSERTLVFWTDFKTDRAIRRVAKEQVSKAYGHQIVGLSYSRTLKGVERHV